MKIWKKILLILVTILIISAGTVFCYSFYKLGKMKTVPISKTNEDLGIKPNENSVVDNDIVNIAFFGLDKRDKTEPGRSDSIMVITLDKLHKKIKLSSIMRDTYVDIKGHGRTKINHAFAYGGAQLAVRTLNENFALNIRDYASVDFFELEKIIDSLGGITIDVKVNELNSMNSSISEVANLEHSSFDKVTNSGTQMLNGKQAVGYSRIRYTAGGDFVRTDRQRTVLSALLTKIQQSGKIAYPNVISKLLPFTETSMSSMDVIKLGTSIFTLNIATLEQERFPIDGYCKGQMIDSVWYLVTDLKATTNHLHNYIYEDVKPKPLAPLF